MKKRMLAVLLAVCLVLAAGTIGASADDEVVTVADGNALTSAFTNGGNIKLSRSFTISSNVVLNNDLRIDLNGYYLNLGSYAIHNKAKLVVDDTSEKHNGCITSSGNHTVIVWNGSEFTLNNGKIGNTMSGDNGTCIFNLDTVTINGGSVIGNTGIYNTAKNGDTLMPNNIVCNINGGLIEGIWGVCAMGQGLDDSGSCNNDKVVVNMTDGTVQCSQGNAGQAFCTNASSGKYAGFTFNMYGGVLDGKDGAGMYLPGIGESNIYDGLVTGDQAIRIAAGELNVTGGEVRGNSASDDEDIRDGGNGGASGAIVAGKTSTGYVGDLVINIGNGASITSVENGTAVFVTDRAMEQSGLADNKIEVNIEGATIVGDVVRASVYENSTDSVGSSTSLNISDSTVTGDIINKSENGNVYLDNSRVSGSVSTTKQDATVSAMDTAVGSVADGSNVAFAGESTVGDEPVAEDRKAVASVNGKMYMDINIAISAASAGDTVEILRNIDLSLEGVSASSGKIDINKQITIDGNNCTINVTAGNENKDAHVINIDADGVVINDLTINGKGLSKHGINVYQASGVELNNVASINNGATGLTVNGSSVTAENFSTSGNGATWGGVNVDPKDKNSASFTLKSGTINESFFGIKIDNDSNKKAAVTIEGGYVCGIYDTGSKENTVVTVNGGSFGASMYGVADVLPDYELKSNGTYTYYDTLSAALAAQGTLGGTVEYVGELAAGETPNAVKYVNNGETVEFSVPDGTSITLPYVSERDGYYFGGWSCGGRLYDEGEIVTVYSDMTFTARWYAVSLPDTYPITVGSAANGSVDVSFSNASKGSVITITAVPDEGYSVGAVTVSGPAGAVEVKRLSATEYSFVMPEGSVTVSVSFVSAAEPFADVEPGDWFYEAVSYVYANGMMQGESATLFNPDAQMTRAMVWATLARLDGETVTGAGWIEAARAWAVASGVSDGTNANGYITRQELVTMLYRYAGSPDASGSLAGFTDAGSVAAWAADAMAWAVNSGIISGMTEDTIVPAGNATRAQCAAIFMRYAA